jgi:predicted lactoylglutathione lyase
MTHMSRQIYLGLPVKDLAKAIGFFTRLGFTPSPQGSDDRTASPGRQRRRAADAHRGAVLPRVHPQHVTDPSTAREVALGLSAASRDQVDDVLHRAVAAGG